MWFCLCFGFASHMSNFIVTLGMALVTLSVNNGDTSLGFLCFLLRSFSCFLKYLVY